MQGVFLCAGMDLSQNPSVNKHIMVRDLFVNIQCGLEIIIVICGSLKCVYNDYEPGPLFGIDFVKFIGARRCNGSNHDPNITRKLHFLNKIINNRAILPTESVVFGRYA